MLTLVVGVIASSAASAACCGVSGDAAARLCGAVRPGSRQRCGGVRRLVLAGPGPQVGAVADHVGLAERAEQREPRWSGPAYQSRSVCEPETSEVRSELPAAAERRQARQPEVGVLHDGAGEAVEPGLLHVDEQLGGGARAAAPPRARRGDHADGGPPPASSDGGQQRAPASASRGRRLKTVMAPSCLAVAVRSLRTCARPLRPRRATLGAMRLLVVEDEVRLARALRRGLTADGLHRRRRRRRCGRARAGPARRLRRGGARRDAAAAVGLRRGPHAARRGELGAGADALGQGRRARPGRRPRLRRGRLPDQAVLVRRAAGPAAGAAAPGAPRPARRCSAPATCGSTRRPARSPSAASRSRSPRASSACWSTSCAAPAGW